MLLFQQRWDRRMSAAGRAAALWVCGVSGTVGPAHWTRKVRQKIALRLRPLFSISLILEQSFSILEPRSWSWRGGGVLSIPGCSFVCVCVCLCWLVCVRVCTPLRLFAVVSVSVLSITAHSPRPAIDSCPVSPVSWVGLHVGDTRTLKTYSLPPTPGPPERGLPPGPDQTPSSSVSGRTCECT